MKKKLKTSEILALALLISFAISLISLSTLILTSYNPYQFGQGLVLYIGGTLIIFLCLLALLHEKSKSNNLSM